MAQDRRLTGQRILATEVDHSFGRTASLALALWAAGMTAGAVLSFNTPAMAGKGDVLSAREPRINVRAGPSTNADILLKIGPQDQVIELASKGQWYFVELPDLRKRGWVHATVIGPAGSVTASTPAAAPDASIGSRSLMATAPPPAAALPLPPLVADEPTPAPTRVEPAAPPPAAAAEEPEVAATDPAKEPPAASAFRSTVRALNERAVSLAGIDLFTDVRSLGGGQIEVVATDAFAKVASTGRESFTNALFEQWRIAAAGLNPLTLRIVDPQGNVVMRRPQP